MRKLFKWIGITLGGLLGLLVLTAIVLYFVGGAKLSKKYDVPVQTVSIPSPNLTSGAGGIGSFYTDEDWVRAIQHGVGHDGRALFLMISKPYHHLGNEDMGALIAYLKSLPAADRKLPERRFEPIGKLMMGTGLFPPFAADQVDHARPAFHKESIWIEKSSFQNYD